MDLEGGGQLGRFAVAAFWLALAACRCWADSAREIFKSAQPATVLIETFDQRGIPLSLGSGFFVATNRLVSCLHVFRDAASATATPLTSKSGIKIGSIISIWHEADLVLVETEQSSDNYLELEATGTWAVGDEVFVLGNPKGMSGTFSSGIVSALRQVANVPAIQITAPISPGNSGGPVLSRNGKVIGVASATLNNAQNINFAVPATSIVRLLEKPNERIQLSQLQRIVPQLPESKPSNQQETDGVVLRDFGWRYDTDASGEFSFSIANTRAQPVQNIVWLISFLNNSGDVVETKLARWSGIVPAKGASRVSERVDPSVRTLNQPKVDYQLMFNPGEYRIGTNLVVKTHKGIFLGGGRQKITWKLNGKPSTDEEVSALQKRQLEEQTSKVMRILRVLSFEHAY